VSEPGIEQHPVAVTAFGKASREGLARVRFWPTGERAIRVAKGLGACWGLALVTLFIPLAHFVLVPGFLIGGLVIAARWSGQTRTYVDVRGHCPACEEETGFKVRGKFLLPKETNCQACHARVILTPRQRSS